MTGLRLDGIRKAFGSVKALDGFDLDTADGELTVIVGPSGCGKSSALRVAAGLEMPDEGRIYIGDRDVSGLAPVDRDVAMVFQNHALFPHLNVADNIGFGLAVRRVPKAARLQRVRDAAATVGCGELLDRMPEAISGGERQRVALARALVRSPSVFLLDEPLSSLDAQLRVSMRTEIRELQRRIGVTTLLVTHDQTEALTMGDRVCVMRDGVAHQSGTPDDVYNRPADRYVATFLGSPAMNVVPAAFDEGVLVAGPFRLTLSPEQREACEANGGSIELGVRPEHVVLGGAGGEPVSRAGAIVALAEMAGAETFLYLDAEGRRVVVRAPSPATGSVSLEREPQRAYVFDSADGRTLLAWEPQR